LARIEVIEGDANEVDVPGRFDLVTAIEILPLFDRATLARFLARIARVTDRLVTNVSTNTSLHGSWVKLRGFQKPVVHTHSPRTGRRALQRALGPLRRQPVPRTSTPSRRPAA
jgi:hypothetical protein